jgi:hypothetical protein
VEVEFGGFSGNTITSQIPTFCLTFTLITPTLSLLVLYITFHYIQRTNHTLPSFSRPPIKTYPTIKQKHELF